MASQSKSAMGVVLVVVCLGLAAVTPRSGAALAGADKSEQIVLKVVGPQGEPLAGAKVYQYYLADDGKAVGPEFVCGQTGKVNLPEAKIFQYESQRKGVVLYGLHEGKLAGFADVKAQDVGKEIQMKLTPACRVHGELRSTDLVRLGKQVTWTNVYVSRNQERPMSYSGRKGEFEFLLPSGNYKLDAYGSSLYGKQEEIKVAPGQKELRIDFDLPADRLAHLVGKDAPELQQVKGWINSKPMKLAGLRGKVVLLDFWGTWCGPCVGEIPKLMGLYDNYHNKGLVIIGVHDDSMSSVKELEKEIKRLSKERWNGREIPFAVALDGGGTCKIEGTELTARGASTAAYGIQAWPTLVLIDKKGEVVKEYDRGGDTRVLEKLLAGE